MAIVGIIQAMEDINRESFTSLLSKSRKAKGGATLAGELNRLKQKGLETERIKQQTLKAVAGRPQSSKAEQTAVKSAGGGGNTLTRTESNVFQAIEGKKPPPKELIVASAGPNKNSAQNSEKLVELIPPRDMAEYIFDTSDVDAVKAAIDGLVNAKKITEAQAEEYMDAITENLNAMHYELMQQLSKEVARQNEQVDDTFGYMISLADMLSNYYQTEEALYTSAKLLYRLFRTDGDVYAKKKLQKFVEVIQNSVAKGQLSAPVKQNVYEIILRAIKDVNSEIGETPGEASKDSPAIYSYQ
ncbi:capsular polysaccharide biosynthesis [Trichuris trichiura]|uniref:Capsular polysaccharide biosynthesis n=1 Tax=Trichuris trichiura TaxID=36087 RepID=A0A077YZT1_TRITR|nr:capsular polysaccharide biosynthesis [Trichuris trichiura]